MAITPDAPSEKAIPGVPPRELAAAASPQNADAAEALQLSSGRSEEELKKQALKRDHERAEQFKDHFEEVAIAGLYLMAFGVAAFAVVWTFHTLTPTQWHWLDASQVDRIQNFVTGGVLAGLIADQFRRRLGGR